MKNKKYLILLSTVLTAVVVIPFLRFGNATAQENQPVFSPALNVLSEELHFTKSAVCGNAISFSAEEFDLAFGMKELPAITILSLPPTTDGTLYLGNLPVAVHQTISRNDLSKLNFHPRNESIVSSSFSLCNGGNEITYNVTCDLYFAPHDNKAPILSAEDKLYLTQTTLSDIAIVDRLRAKDPEGGQCTFVIKKYPEKGVLTLTDATTGEYSYIPRKDALGQDTVTYYAMDCYGAPSEEFVINISIQASEKGILYTDLVGHSAHLSAIHLTQQGIMSGNDVGGLFVFRPNETISKSEFIVMAMKSVNYPILSSNAELPFSDSNEIASVYTDYIYTAWKADIIEAETTENGNYFYPNNTITKAEAAVIVQKLIQAAIPVDVPVFSDADAVPSWAENAIQTLCGLGILDTDAAGKIHASEVINRADGAKLLYRLYQYSIK